MDCITDAQPQAGFSAGKPAQPGSQVLIYLYSTSGDGEVQKRGALHCGASTCKATNAPVLELALQEQPATYSKFTITACQELFRWKCRSPGQYRNLKYYS